MSNPTCKHCGEPITFKQAASDAPMCWWHVCNESPRYRQYCEGKDTSASPKSEAK